jgi:hypothetical protein
MLTSPSFVPLAASGEKYNGSRYARKGRDVSCWPTGLATLAGRDGRYRSKFRRDDYEARRLKVTPKATPRNKRFMLRLWVDAAR